MKYLHLLPKGIYLTTDIIMVYMIGGMILNWIK